MTPTETLIMHWDGESWSIVTSPSPGTHNDVLYGLDAISAGDIWAVGSSSNSDDSLIPLAMRWDGVRWSVVATPKTSASFDTLFSVKAFAQDDAWAVGYQGESHLARRTLIMHWDGTSWSIIPSPNPSSAGNALFEVDGISTNDIWAVGGSTESALTLHWDGVTWGVVPSPKAGEYSNLEAVAAISADDVWAVGSYYADNAVRGLIEHWDGTQWNVIPSADIGDVDVERFIGVVAIRPDDIWAVGNYGSFESPEVLIEHWDGTRWTRSPSISPYALADSLSLDALTATSPDDIWAVGIDAIIMRYSSDF
ncbi:MAG TPA: hypothetical protein VEW94_01510, partial [Chloroflexia bacterium]|nr:hypothetical protein [Chloroflexia bacterium]